MWSYVTCILAAAINGDVGVLECQGLLLDRSDSMKFVSRTRKSSINDFERMRQRMRWPESLFLLWTLLAVCHAKGAIREFPSQPNSSTGGYRLHNSLLAFPSTIDKIVHVGCVRSCRAELRLIK